MLSDQNFEKYLLFMGNTLSFVAEQLLKILK